MDGDSNPVTGVFTVKVNDSLLSLASANPVAVAGRHHRGQCQRDLAAGHFVTVIYTKPSGSPLQNVICEDETSFPNVSVMNLTQ